MPTDLVLPRHLNHGIPDDNEAHPVGRVNGLFIINNFLTPEQQKACIDRVDADSEAWRNDLRRRVQHHGWRYDYRNRAITPDMYLGELPDYLQELAEKIFDETGLFNRVPEQVIVNEYQPGQGISTHIDHRGFGPEICTISLLDDWEMEFSIDWETKSPALLPKGSCLLLTGPARHKWQHGIMPKRWETGENGTRYRKRRVSLTFRTVLNRDNINEP